MIIWITGQPGSGKSTLAKALAAELMREGHRVTCIDGDELRAMTGNRDYSDAGRVLNVRTGQQMAAELVAKGIVVVASFVSPHRWLREELKQRHEVLEIYTYTQRPTSKDAFRVSSYEPPLERFMPFDMGETPTAEAVKKIQLALVQALR